MEKVTYGGIADAHGIESFLPLDQIGWQHEMRANSNRQRHALVFTIECTQEYADEILNMIEGKPSTVTGKVWSEGSRYTQALKKIKNQASEDVKAGGKYHGIFNLSIQKGCEKSWKLIPNPDLDPWA